MARNLNQWPNFYFKKLEKLSSAQDPDLQPWLTHWNVGLQRYTREIVSDWYAT